MVGLFLRLKLRLLRNTLRMGTAYVTGFVILTTCGLVGGLALALGVANGPTALSVVVFNALVLAWIVAPVVLSAIDESLDASRLVSFPLSHRQVVTGLLAASFVGVGPVVTAVVLTGAAIGAGGGVGGTAAAVVGALLMEVLCVVVARTVTTTLSNVLRSRRGRDLAAGAVVLVGLLPAGASALTGRLVQNGNSLTVIDRLAAALRWTPPGMAAQAAADARSGRPLAALAQLAVVAAVVAGLIVAWSLALARLTVHHDASNRAVRAGGVGSSGAFSSGPFSSGVFSVGPLTRLGDTGRAGAVAARDLRYQWRDPRRRMLWVQIAVVLVFVLGPTGRTSGLLLLLGLSFVSVVLAMQAAQQFGYDGAAYWMHVAAISERGDVRRDLLGKTISASLIGVPVLVMAAVVGAVATGRAPLAAVAVAVVLGAYGVGLACATLLSVWFPVPLPDSSRNVFGSVDPGRGCLAGLAGLGAMLATLGVTTAFAVPLVTAHGVVAVGLGAAFVALGLGAGIGARAVAARIAFGRLPELLAAVTPRGG